MKVIAISGKRCVGKDTLAALLADALLDRGLVVEIRSLAWLFKAHLAERYNLDLDRLLHDREYKEEHREFMIQTFEQWHRCFPLLCCTRALECDADVLIISDLRLQSDLAYLAEHSELTAVRIKISEQARIQHGWKSSLIDQHWTEVDLDNVPDSKFLCIENSLGLNTLKNQAIEIANQI